MSRFWRNLEPRSNSGVSAVLFVSFCKITFSEIFPEIFPDSPGPDPDSDASDFGTIAANANSLPARDAGS